MANEEEIHEILGSMVKSKAQRSIKPDLEQIGIFPDIITAAEDYYQEHLGAITKRKSQRKQMIFDSVYRAHKKLGKTISPYDLADKIGIEKGKIGKARSENFSKRTTRVCEAHVSTVEQYLSYYVEKLEIGEYKEIILQYKRSLKFPNDLENKPPNAIALAIIHLFNEQNPIKDFDKKNIIKSGLTQANIKLVKNTCQPKSGDSSSDSQKDMDELNELL